MNSEGGTSVIMIWFTTSGILRFDPLRPGMKRRTEWWCIVEVDNSIQDYYRWLMDREWWNADRSTIKRCYVRPSWNGHLSVIRGEEPRKNEYLWGVGSGEKVVVRYDNQIRQTQNALHSGEVDKFWYINAEWDGYVALRKQFGLPVTTYDGISHKSHITIARTHE